MARSSARRPLPGRVIRIDRGWSTVLLAVDEPAICGCATSAPTSRSATDRAIVSSDGERVETVLDRHSRRSCVGHRSRVSRASAHTLAANIDVVLLVHTLAAPPNQRRLERELVLALDSGADPVVVLTKTDLVDDPEPATVERCTTWRRRAGAHRPAASPATRARGARWPASGRGATIALLGASGVGKTTLVNALLGNDRQATAAVRDGDQRGRHTTTACAALRLPGGGWLIDTPGVRAVSLWLSGHGIERAFADVFELMDHCRFRDCKHDQEPGCAVRQAIAAGTLDPGAASPASSASSPRRRRSRTSSARTRSRSNRRGVRKPKPSR